MVSLKCKLSIVPICFKKKLLQKTPENLRVDNIGMKYYSLGFYPFRSHYVTKISISFHISQLEPIYSDHKLLSVAATIWVTTVMVCCNILVFNILWLYSGVREQPPQDLHHVLCWPQPQPKVLQVSLEIPRSCKGRRSHPNN
jgi:hypothetical protein